ncbi:hypothetical protein [Nocardia veterana]|uniref:Uncharacterized protein n=1 Tax=Nocardia veterana TaxID=132249 RepID=A0A7X6LWF6_9NOCA|nr:hypothetical protein [Nocardia veterana]NKY85854.1 hypothetical protein [Nocardia veterana]
MNDPAPQWKRQSPPPGRRPPQALVDAAAANPGGSVVDIDPAWVDDPNGFVPPGAVRGRYEVDERGGLTGAYHRNPHHTAPRDDVGKLLAENCLPLLLMGTDPGAALRAEILRTLTAQIEGTRVDWIWVHDTPRHQIAGKPKADGYLTVSRAALGVPFALSVRAPGRRREVLAGTFTWIWAGLDQPDPSQRVWLDLGMSADWAQDQFPSRMFEV